MEAVASPTKAPELAPAVSWRQAMNAPLKLRHPRQAAQVLCGASTRTFAATYLAYCLLLVVVFLLAFLWDEMFTRQESFGPAEVWRRWHRRSVIGVPEWTALLVILCTPVLNALAAWLYLPSMHRTGSVAASYWLAYRAVAAGMGLVVILTLVIGLLIAAVTNARELGDVVSPDADFLIVPPIPASVALLVYWLAAAVRGLGEELPHVEPSPRCEGCGYDLTHQGIDGRCTECGLDVAASLDPQRRPGPAWERSRRPNHWLRTVIDVVARPGWFYQRLKLRVGPEHARRFSRWNFVLIGLGAGAWIFGMLITDRYPPPGAVLCAIPLMFSIAAPLAGWTIARLVGAFSVSAWIMRQSLADVRWSQKAMAYESAFLWVFCAWNGLMITSFVRWDDWIARCQERFLGHRAWILGVPHEVLVLLLGNAVLCLIWLLRYRVILRAIRWSNY